MEVPKIWLVFSASALANHGRTMDSDLPDPDGPSQSVEDGLVELVVVQWLWAKARSEIHGSACECLKCVCPWREHDFPTNFHPCQLQV